MELPNLGVQCSELNCKQLDFLPFKCKCGLIFCSEHFIEHSLDCAAVQCNNEPNLEKVPADHVCSHPECSNRSYVPLICEQCNKHFCVVHRHIGGCVSEEPEEINTQLEKYAAPVRKFEEAKKKVNDQLDASIEEAKKKTKTRHLANKVQLMRIKNKATGLKSIPSADRIYFNIQHPVVKNSTEASVYVSKHWTLGRIIDAIAEECKVANKNNQSNAHKLRLFHKSSRTIVTTDLSIKLEELLLNESVMDGDELLLEYVEA